MDPMGSSSKFSADDLSGKSFGLLRPQQVGILKTSPENPIGFADGIGYAATLKKWQWQVQFMETFLLRRLS
jgi:hypothetical protein